MPIHIDTRDLEKNPSLAAAVRKAMGQEPEITPVNGPQTPESPESRLEVPESVSTPLHDGFIPRRENRANGDSLDGGQGGHWLLWLAGSGAMAALVAFGVVLAGHGLRKMPPATAATSPTQPASVPVASRSRQTYRPPVQVATQEPPTVTAAPPTQTTEQPPQPAPAPVQQQSTPATSNTVPPAPASSDSTGGLIPALVSKYQALGLPLQGAKISTDVQEMDTKRLLWGWARHFTVESQAETSGGQYVNLGSAPVANEQQADAMVAMLKASNSFLFPGNPPPITGSVVRYPGTDNYDLPITVGVMGPNGQISFIDGRIDSGSQTTNFPQEFLQAIGYSPTSTGKVVGVTGTGAAGVYNIPTPYAKGNGQWYPLGSGDMQVWGLPDTQTALIGADLLSKNTLTIQGDTWTLQLGSATAPVPPGDTGDYSTLDGQ